MPRCVGCACGVCCPIEASSVCATRDRGGSVRLCDTAPPSSLFFLSSHASPTGGGRRDTSVVEGEVGLMDQL